MTWANKILMVSTPISTPLVYKLIIISTLSIVSSYGIQN